MAEFIEPDMDDRDKTLLQTKLHRPPITRDLIVRSRLLERLNSNINRPLTLVCAPAGFGKTTLVCTWLERMAAGQDEKATCLPSAWLSLDEKDSDINLFLRYFIAALRTIFSDACAETLALLEAQQQTTPGRNLSPRSVMSSQRFPEKLFSCWTITTPSAGRRYTVCCVNWHATGHTAAPGADLTHRSAHAANRFASEGDDQ